MLTCPNCERPYEGDPDFCPSCGEYLRWNPTGYQAAVPAPPAAGPAAGNGAPPPVPAAVPRAAAPVPAGPSPGAPPPPVPPAAQPQAPPVPEPVLLALRRPEDEGYATAPLDLRVPPGGSVELRALVRNQSGIVDNYDLAVEGMPAEWSQVTPATVYLVPYGSPQGSYEQEVVVRVAPPRSPEAEARRWPLAVTATSRADASVTVKAPCGVEVEPYAEVTTEIAPERRGARVQARYAVAITNLANAPVEVALQAVDPEDALGFEFQRPPGATGGTPVDPARLAERAANAAQRLGPDALDPAKAAQRAMADLKSGGGGRILGKLLRKKPAGPRVTALRIGPGERAETVLSVTVPKPIYIGRPAMRPFQVTPRPLAADTPSPPAGATLVHRPWLPWWLAIVVPLLVVAAVWFLSNRSETVAVPDLRTAPDAFAADGILKDAGLVLEKPPQEVPAADGQKAGAIVDQVPPAGKEVAKGTSVAIKIAVAPQQVPVPDLTGKTLAEAQGALAAAGLQLGPPAEQPADPQAAVIATQTPLAGQQAAKGSAVGVTFKAAGAKPGTTTPTTPATTSGGGAAPPPATPPASTPSAPSTPSSPTTPATPGAGGTAVPAVVPPRQPAAAPPPPPVDVPSGPGGSLVMPNLAAQDADAAQTSLQRVGLTATLAYAYSGDVAAGRVLAQDPAPDTPVQAGAPVTITVSLGEPEVLFDNGDDLFRASGVDGGRRQALTRGPELETQGSVSRDGRMVAYRVQPDPKVASAAQIWVMDLKDPRSAHPLTNSGFDDRRPAISPDGKTVAFASNREEADTERGLNLCFVPVDANAAAPSCVADDAVSVTRPAWSPDGRAIVVAATQGAITAPDQVELQEYTSSTPNSAKKDDWVARSLLTDSLHRDRKGDIVFSAAYAPDGTRLAFTANWDGRVGTVRLLPVSADGIVGDKVTELPNAAGCEVAWRPDGGELLVSRRAGADCRGRGQVGRVDLARGDFDPLTPAGGEAGAPAFIPVG